jgi:drug/metabolite transporter (DMT)-like permease
VNPVIAVILGWAFGGEAITGRVALAAAAIIAAVVVITRHQAGGKSPEPASRPTGVLATDSQTAR